MSAYHQIRALYDRDTITVYQAYNQQIAQLAVQQQKFVSPFSFHRMTWIKPSFLWLMERSHWATKSNQNHILAIRIQRDFGNIYSSKVSIQTRHSLRIKMANTGLSLLKMPRFIFSGILNGI